jgi:hypothetical protein
MLGTVPRMTPEEAFDFTETRGARVVEPHLQSKKRLQPKNTALQW